MDTIFTLNARGNVYFDVLSDVFEPSPSQMMIQIQSMFRSAVRDLKESGVSYADLKTALVPSLENHEVALIFDTTSIESYSYGSVVIDKILPLLEPRSTQSILAGDLVADDGAQDFMFDMLHKHVVWVRDFEYEHSNYFYCVYLNNVTETSLVRIDEGLRSFNAYLGLIPTTYASVAKAYLSAVLVNVGVKRGTTVILPHEDDRPNDENVNITPYSFEDHGFSIKSIRAHDFNHFLSYKIERPTWAGFESDTHFSLNAIANVVLPLAGMDIHIEEKKYGYLIDAGKLIKAELTELSNAQLTDLIRSKIQASYIYNLRYIMEHDTRIFNVVIEVERPASGGIARMIVALEYRPDDNLLRMVTLF